ncbi:hypothetical protein [Mycoplasma seminis]|uniref:Uncharacterized protein n=1 Tax=Mycoplasma seminis TaxID=512749 RepID=A0ABY9HB30_9MOLU|nr:hypothetical protein [Mycoplasma seminis]WLP85395.1 hypothetical protein Q8852_03680 [Mycoplasma seminis]
MIEKQKKIFLKRNIFISFLGGLFFFLIAWLLTILFIYLNHYYVLNYFIADSQSIYEDWRYVLFDVIVILMTIPWAIFTFFTCFELFFNYIYRSFKQWRYIKENRFPSKINKIELLVYKYFYVKPQEEMENSILVSEIRIKRIKKIFKWFPYIYPTYYIILLILDITLLISGISPLIGGFYILFWVALSIPFGILINRSIIYHILQKNNLKASQFIFNSRFLNWYIRSNAIYPYWLFVSSYKKWKSISNDYTEKLTFQLK